MSTGSARASTNWWRELLQVAAILVVAGLTGVFFEVFFPALLLAGLALGAYWFYQLRRAALWIRQPESEPPTARGVWGDIFDGIYHLQRHEREERDRLQTAVSYLRDSFAALNNATVIIDPAGNIEWCNDAARQLLGLEYPRDQGQALLNLIRIPSFHSYFSAADYSEPLYMESPHKATIKLLVEVTSFGRGSRLLFARDVTREERMEEMRRDFIANVSHELRTPLTVITGYLYTLTDSGLLDKDERWRKPLTQMQQQAQRMENLLRDLLWLSRLESAPADKTEHTPVAVAEMLAEVRQECLNVHPDREINIEIDTDLPLQGDYRQLYSAVSNLVLNALKYSEGPVQVNWWASERNLCLSVRDFGPGIEAVHLPRLTERFYRVEKSRSQQTGGTGLGLAIVKHILAGHDGYLEIESELGVGSCFSCLFPLS